MNHSLFPIAQYWWLYLGFSAVVIVLLAIDLSLHRKARVVTLRSAALWSLMWMTLALIFSGALYLFISSRHGAEIAYQSTLEFLAGYVVEESLSVDNMFVFALIFRYFAIPPRHQHQVLFYGVLGAMVFRAIFIGIGAALLRFEWIMILFGVFLVVTGIRMAFDSNKRIEPEKSPIVRWAGRFLPVTTELHGGQFLVTLGGRRYFTPLLIVLLFLETTDIMFAVDSVPAVFAVTREPFLVFTSNIFAILGLRSLYFLLADALDRFYALQYGLGAVLVFVGLKMIWLDHLFDGRFPIGISLAIIGGILGISIAISLAYPRSAVTPSLPSAAGERE